ncbi:hypothetical protein MRX96_018826 [Rhipicephalus microplus]
MAPMPPVVAPSRVKKRCQCGSYKKLMMVKKAEMIRQVEGGRPQSEVSQEFFISKQTVSDYLKRKAKILKASEKASAVVQSMRLVDVSLDCGEVELSWQFWVVAVHESKWAVATVTMLRGVDC